MRSSNDSTINQQRGKVRKASIDAKNATKTKKATSKIALLPPICPILTADSTIVLEKGVVTLLFAPQINHGAFA